MKSFFATLVLCFLLAGPVLPVFAEPANQKAFEQMNALGWQRSKRVTVANVATVNLPPKLKAIGLADTSKFLELRGNPPSQGQYAISADDYQWFAIFSFDPAGYVKDDEKIDPAALLQELKTTNVRNVEERKRLGLEQLFLDGWYVQPHYDLETKRLEWGVKFHGERGETVINYTARMLGRSGVMTAILVSDPTTLDQDVESFHSLLKAFDFVGGERYAEFKQGDKIAEYGLAALVVGGTAAVAAKTGAGFIKVIGLAIVGFLASVWAFIKRQFRRNKGSA